MALASSHHPAPAFAESALLHCWAIRLIDKMEAKQYQLPEWLSREEGSAADLISHILEVMCLSCLLWQPQQ